MVVDTDKCKMELMPALKRTFQGEVKPSKLVAFAIEGDANRSLQ